MLQLLMAVFGVERHCVNDCKQNALFAAVRAGLNSNLETLLDGQLKLVADDKGTTPLHLAVLRQNFEAIRMMALKFTDKFSVPG